MILFPHGDCKLIHDSTVYAIEIVLGILSDQCQILIRHIKSEEIP